MPAVFRKGEQQQKDAAVECKNRWKSNVE